jgi:Undecaprenyl-phosphate glucose phosphotransferase
MLRATLARPRLAMDSQDMTDLELRAKFGAPALMNRLGPVPAASRETPDLSEQALDVARRFSDDAMSPGMVAGMMRGLEGLAILALGVFSHGGVVLPSGESLWAALLPLLVAPCAGLILLQALGAYDPASFGRLLDQCGRVIAAWTLLFAGFALFAFFTRNGLAASGLWFGIWYLMGLVMLISGRALLTIVVNRWIREGRFQRRAVIVGGGESAAELIRSLEAARDRHVQICGIFDDRAGNRSPAIVQGYPRLGTIAELVTFGRIAKIDMLIVALPITAETRLLEILRQLWVLPVDIRLSAHMDKLRFRPRAYSYIGAVPFVDVIERPIAGWDTLIKRGFDLMMAGAAIIMLAPLLLGTAAAIKLDSRGPVLFRQKRYGFNNEVIDVFKFRSMHAESCDYEARVAVTKDDPRVTPIGRIIRKTSIDELPQLFNVLIGNLSLVGPRPHAVGSNTGNKLWEAVVDGYFARHRVKPGVTGWAQIHGWRGEIDTQEKLQQRVAHDLYYIENWSPLLDLLILARTPFALFNTKNAY